MVKLLLVDDHPLVRMGLRVLIERQWDGDSHVVEAGTLEAAVAAYRHGRPDIIVLDLGLPDAQGAEGLVRMKRLADDVPILVLSLNKDASHIQRLLQLGAAGYVSKDRTDSELLGALRRVLNGGRSIPAEVAEYMMKQVENNATGKAPHELLAPQEYRVMQLIAAGHTPARIAELMHLSVKTVGNYRMRILDKTGWQNNIDLTKYCLQNGLADAL